MMPLSSSAFRRRARATYAIDDVKVACTKCGSLLDIRYDWSKLPVPKKLDFFEGRWATKGTEHEGKLDFSGVWRFRELCRSIARKRTSSRSARVERFCSAPICSAGSSR